MGHLLKEGLKTLCGVNQWSYAVFWKFGCQNPKLLVWEECYCKPAACPGDVDASWISAEDNVHLLVNKMMMDSHFSIVGEGLVGRVAFTGDHQWILSQTYYGNSHPPEVVEEVRQQFSAGMQTVVVIPVVPHGVVQFGSCMTVMENLGFINDVTSLILQLGALLAPNYQAKEHAACYEASSEVADAPGLFGTFDYAQNTSHNELQINSAAFQATNSNPDGIRLQDYHREPRITLPVINGVAKAEVISSNSELWRNQDTYMYRPSSALGGQLLDEVNGLCIGSEPNDMFHQVETSNSSSVDCFTSNSLLAYSSDSKLRHMDNKFGEIEFHSCQKEMGRNTMQANDFPLPQFMAELIPGFVQDDVCVQPELGDDLFDILGPDFKNKLFNGCMSNASAPKMQPLDSKNNLPPNKSLAYLELHGNSESGIFSSTGPDHLLEAEVSKIKTCSKQSMDDEISCRTTLTNTSSPNASLPYGRFPVSDPLEYMAKAGAMSSSSLLMGSSKQESRSYSHGSSIPGKAKPSNSGHSKISDEAGKASRKRLKPGESPRPRPKDRQMFQDRVRELREIVPNGAKCSLDALLERTIKHMLFLQSVSKHADMLKQTGDSKVVDKDGSLLLKDKFEGGATWAYEVGSQSMVCPIIVEDLNQPRQMLVQMLCEERGMFLEIADIIRGLGLTILKGVMEMRNDKIWARFAVEANRDVTRMEIFMSLVRLLEQSLTGISNDNPTAQQFHQVASVPLGC